VRQKALLHKGSTPATATGFDIAAGSLSHCEPFELFELQLLQLCRRLQQDMLPYVCGISVAARDTSCGRNRNPRP
jgi:hypothetical protein